MWRFKHIVLLGVMVAGLVSCRQDEPTHAVSLEFNLCLPAQEMAYHAPVRRSMGDPGTNEVLALPKYAYIFVTKEEGDVKTLWQKKEITMNAENWEMIRYTGRFATEGDYIYRYNKREVFLLSNSTPKGKIYVICSNKKLTLTPTFASVSTLDDILNLQFNTAPDSIQANLQNIYSTPYNYIKDGNYYCTYDCSARNVYTTDLLLYHVAAKVDINWYVDKEVRINKADPSAAVRLTYMDAKNLFNGNAYCFKPLENVVATPLAAGATKHIIGDGDEGMWWEGRSYLYTIPYTTEESGKENYFPLQMLMVTNNSGNEYKPTIYMQIDKTSPFTPWLRANFNLSTPLSAGTPTKIVNY